MDLRLFHIFRNTPLGRETLLQTIYFCRMLRVSPLVYIPKHIKFLMYFDSDVVQVDLDRSYMDSPNTANQRAAALLEKAGLRPRFYDPKNYTASTLPDIPTNFDFMCCPRSIIDLSSKIGLGYIGPRVRRIVQSARFPVLITSAAYKEWKRIAVFFGGSKNAVKALKLGFQISRSTGMPLEIFTKVERGMSRKAYESIIKEHGLDKEMDASVEKWHLFKKGRFEENLYAVPHDALAVVGAYGHTLIRELLFGSKMERIQTTLPNNFLIVGPNYTATG